jgi:hypothetical protein
VGEAEFRFHTRRDYMSILRLIEDTFNVAHLALRHANADDSMEFFDFSTGPPRRVCVLTPPLLVMHSASMSGAQLRTAVCLSGSHPHFSA